MPDHNKKKKNSEKKDSLGHLDMATAAVVSSGDMTGLIQQAPHSNEDQEAYEELYEYTGSPLKKRGPQ
ncbi:MAG: hypothetical protein FWH02_06540 [Oscillospiraceae bacterium]|nr:hypothetical protein [Oscillospiraceae bacterium]